MSKPVEKILSVLLMACTLLLSLSVTVSAEKSSALYPAVSHNITQVVQKPGGCYIASVAMCGLWNSTISGAPEDAYYNIYDYNKNYVPKGKSKNLVQGATLKYIKYKQVNSNLTLSNLYVYLKKGPVIVGETCNKGTHYAIVYAYTGNSSSLNASGFQIMDTKITAYRLSDETKLTTNGKTTLDKWIKGSSYVSFTYNNGSAATTSSKNTCTVTLNANGGSVSYSSVYVTKNNTYGTLPTPKRNGYKFDGWYTKASGGTKVTASTKVTSSHTLYAHWSRIPSLLTVSSITVSNISQNSAKVSAKYSYTGARPSEVSVYIGTSQNNLKKYSSDKINHSKNPFDVWYNLKGLKAGTTYYYQFHAVVDGKDKAYGEIKSFTTKPMSSTLTINVKGATKIAKNSARVDAICTYTGTRPSEVSVYIGTSKNNMRKYSSDAINHNKNPFNIWYNLSGLKKNTTYYYQFHAKVNGVDKAYGDLKSFKTAR